MATDQEELDFDVIIIGAGWAGLSAGRHLHDAGVSKFVILEGRHEIGGRCRTVCLNDTLSVAELGAQWIHDSGESNPVYRVAVESGVAIAPCDRDSGAVYRMDQDEKGSRRCCRRVPWAEVDKQQTALMKKGFLPYQKKRQTNDDNDVTLRECVDDYLQKIRATTEQKAWLNYMLDSEVSQEYAASLEDLSMHWWDAGEELGNDGDTHVPQDPEGGYRGILNFYAKSIQDRIQCSSKVRCIDWSLKDKVVIQYRRNGRPCKLLTAKRVLITVPLGVLKANTIQFLPALPEAKQSIISKMGVGLLNKCILLWDEKDIQDLPWPQDKEWLEKIDDEHQGLWTEFYNPYPLTHRPMLCAFTAGRIAARIESLPDQDIQDQVLESLRNMFAPRVIPDPIQVIITKWGQDEFAMGSYSFNAYGAKHRFRDRLADPVDDRLFFAGEACHSKFPSTTYGAFLSGANVANAIVRLSS